MNMRLVLVASFAALLSATGAEAAVSVIGGGQAETCYRGADEGGSPATFLVYCNQALVGPLDDRDVFAPSIQVAIPFPDVARPLEQEPVPARERRAAETTPARGSPYTVARARASRCGKERTRKPTG